ncbi:MAG: hypothetical protein AAB895_03965, partial [Patescibacteria group bacterium]
MGEASAHVIEQLFKHFFNADQLEYFLTKLARNNLPTVFQSLRDIYEKDFSGTYELRMKRFYHEVFDIGIDDLPIPHSNVFGNFMYLDPRLNLGLVLDKCKKFFPVEISCQLAQQGNPSVSGYSRPVWFGYHGYKSHDKQISGESYSFCKKDPSLSFMNLGQYLLCQMFYYWLTGRRFDEESWTLLDELSKEGKPLIVCSQ